MGLPAPTGSGLSLTLIDKSALAVTVVVVVALLLPELASDVAEATATVFDSTLPFETATPTFTTGVNLLPAASEVAEQLTVPCGPTAGVVQDQPIGFASDTNVVPAGRVSARVGLSATLGPAFATVIV